MYGEQTINYKTYVKRALVEGMSRVFDGHVDKILAGTRVTIEYPHEKADYPTVVVRFFERDIKNAGVGHYEMIEGRKMKHYLYSGDIELAIFALSSLDRDFLADTIVQIITMGDIQSYTNEFFERIYNADETEIPQAHWNYLNVNSDRLLGFGETQTAAPWKPEDTMIYQTSYRCAVAGEFYSLFPDQPVGGLIRSVPIYPYIGKEMGDLDPVPEGDPRDTTTTWLPEGTEDD